MALRACPPAVEPVSLAPATALVRRARKVDRVLAETYPDARCELDFDNPFQLLVVTVLSAQTTDKRVNAVRPTLFAAYPDARRDGGRRPRATSSRSSGPLGFFRAKTESLLKLSQALVERYDGEVPPRLEDLVTLPGVGRKTANVVLGNAFGVPGSPSTPTSAGWPAGSAGPTRPTRSRSSTPWASCSPARLDDAQPPPDLARPAGLPRPKPPCGACPVARWCPSYGEGPIDPEAAAAWCAPRAGMRRAALARVPLLVLTGCARRLATLALPGPAQIDVDTPSCAS